MKNVKLMAALAAVGASFVSFEAHAGMVTDAHGNVGYDTAAECDAAVQAGNAKFYQSFTHKPALKRAGEVSVRTATIKDLGPQYRLGACDLGVGRKGGRDGVSKALQGKYVPFSPDMPIHVYSDASGQPVRVTMQQCDNWFSGNAPRPVAIPQPKPVAAEPKVHEPCACVGPYPYVFGSVGVQRDGVSTPNDDYYNHDTRFAGQIGAGVQFSEYLGGELYYQGGEKHKYNNHDSSESFKARNHTLGARLTVGTSVYNKARVFAKAGLAAVRHTAGNGYKHTKARPTVGVGASYDLTDHWAVRADYDHYFKRDHGQDVKWRSADYFGIGAQYKF